MYHRARRPGAWAPDGGPGAAMPAVRRYLMALAAVVLLGAPTAWLVVYGGVLDAYRKQVVGATHLEEFKARADDGDVEAEFAVGRHYDEGLGVERDPAIAALWYARAAEKGHAGAQFALGRKYAAGDGVRHNYYKAAEWYSLAASIGRMADAQFALGQLYFHGRGVPHDYAEAMIHLKKAAARGHAAAQFLVGAMYEEGWAVERDYVEAYMWYSLVTPQAEEAMRYDPGFDPAAARAALEPRMSQFQVAEAERAAGLWRAQP